MENLTTVEQTSCQLYPGMGARQSRRLKRKEAKVGHLKKNMMKTKPEKLFKFITVLMQKPPKKPKRLVGSLNNLNTLGEFAKQKDKPDIQPANHFWMFMRIRCLRHVPKKSTKRSHSTNSNKEDDTLDIV
ncbi:hypothetical protein OUZ56_018238 [Daphnia magna]|uniref:Uncharacterized protein n=1 Tax=Daphnia magna TaxID=35525 RepID=A0ABQ9Z8D0_9CRUS|nr:hypothetical protein OUZ56_018238 [Daphnia magna]